MTNGEAINLFMQQILSTNLKDDKKRQLKLHSPTNDDLTDNY